MRANLAWGRRLAALGVALGVALTAYSASAAPCAGFVDVEDTDSFCSNVQWLKNRSITLGCPAAAPSYCPGGGVTRLQMAAFLNRFGTALTPVQLSVDTAPGAIDLDLAPVVCQTTDSVAAGFARVAYVDVRFSGKATAAVGLAADLVMSTDGGASWANLNVTSDRGFVAANRWGALYDLGFATLEPAQSARWGVRMTRGGVAGGADLVDSRCELRVRIYGRDESAPPVVKVLATIANASEVGPSHGQFTILRSGGNLAAPLPVPFTLGGTATACADYACIPSITIPAGMTSVQVLVTVLQDTLAEATETAILTLTPDPSLIIGAPSAVATIANGPPPVNLPPTVNAGADQTITLPATASLAGSVADDGFPNPPAAVAVTWSKVSGPGVVSFVNASVAVTTASFSVAGTYVLRLTADDSASSSTDDVTVTVNPSGSGGLLPGPPGDPANSHIPNIAITDPAPADLVAPSGVPISVRDLLVNFKDSATVGQVNSLLQTLGAEVAGGIPAGKLLFLRLRGPSDLNRILNAQETLLASPLVSSATINFAMAEDQLPPFNIDPTNSRWTWQLPLDPNSGNWGLKRIRMPQAWNLVDHSRTLNASIDVAVLEAGGLISGVDPNHVDMPPGVNVAPGQSASEHATMVGGFIGAVWNNNAGVEGVYPRALTIVSRPANFVAGAVDQTVNAVIGLLLPINVQVINYSAGTSKWYRINGIDPVTALVNPAAPVGPGNPTYRGQMDVAGNTFLNTVRAAETSPGGRSSFLMFCSAGNLRLRPTTALDYQARDNSVCANVAVRGATPDPASPLPAGGAGADHFFAIEAMDSLNNRSHFSAAGGTLSAPGTCVRSLEFNNGVNYDAPCPGNDGADANSATQNGTSFATPITAGLATYIWSLNQNLTYQQVRQIITDPANRAAVAAGPLGGSAGRERIDAFAAVLGIDVLLANDVNQRKAIQRALVDVDDGTDDGNLRIDPFTGTVNTTINHPDLRRGDGMVSIQDFRAWRDAYLQVNLADVAGTGIDVFLDGAQTHFKKDLNFDGCVAGQNVNPGHPVDVPVPPGGCLGAPLQNVYPRYDFNGDGQVGSWFKTAPFKVDPEAADPDNPPGENRTLVVRQAPGFLRDVDVIADFELWAVTAENVETDPAAEGLPAAQGEWGPRRFLLGNRDAGIPVFEDIPDYLHSFDLHLQLDWARINANYEGVKIQVAAEMVANYAQTFDREITVPKGAQPPVVTLPIWTGRVKVTFTGVDNVAPNVAPTDPGYLQPTTKELTGLRFGEDRSLVHPRFPTVIDVFGPGRTNIATDAAGTIYVAYERQVSSSSDGSEIREHYFARSADGGITWSARQIASEQRRRDSLAVSGTGNVYIAHVLGNPSQPAPIGNASVQLIRSADGGVTFSPRVISTAGATNVDFHTEVATDASGKVYVVWAESGTNPAAPEAKNPYMIRMRTSTDGGQTFSAPTTIHADPSPGALWYPRGAQIAVTPDGQQVHVTWTQCIQTDGSGNCLNFSLRYSRSVGGSPFSAPVGIAQSQFLASFYDMVADAAGNVSVVYPSSGASNSTVMFVRVESGASVRTVNATLTPFGFFAFAPRLGIDAFGGAWITWFEGSSSVPSEVFTLRTNDGGQSFSALRNMSNTPSGPSGAPSIAPDRNGAPIMVWGEQGTPQLLFSPVLSP